MLTIKKIQLKELTNFVESKIYQRLSVVPITPARLKSFILNPRAEQNDVVLYLGFVEGKLVAFRSLFADLVHTKNEQIRFAWCSGNWVHPNFRREGFSKQLLLEAHNDWNGKLMFTNYATASEMLYLKTGWFHSIHQFKGYRAYLFPKTRKLISFANKNLIFKIIFSIVDFVITLFSSARLVFFTIQNISEIRFETIDLPDNQCFDSIQKSKVKYLFNRGETELKWIFENPWISISDKTFENKYPFSSFSKSFFYKTVKVSQEDNFLGFFIFSVRNGNLKTLYFNLSKPIEKEISNYLKEYCSKNKIEKATIYNTNISHHFSNQKFPFLRVKEYGQKIYSSFEIPETSSFHFQDGDGDVFFT